MKLRELKARKPLEREIQAGIIRLFRSCGGVVYSTSQGYRSAPGGTRMTPGLPDLIVFFPRLGRLLFFEVKREGAKRTPAQEAFAAHATGVPSVFCDWGGMTTAMTLLRVWGLVR